MGACRVALFEFSCREVKGKPTAFDSSGLREALQEGTIRVYALVECRIFQARNDVLLLLYSVLLFRLSASMTLPVSEKERQLCLRRPRKARRLPCLSISHS